MILIILKWYIIISKVILYILNYILYWFCIAILLQMLCGVNYNKIRKATCIFYQWILLSRPFS